MTQSPSAEVVPTEATTAHTAGTTLALRNRRNARLLIVLVAIPAVLALALTGVWVTGATRSAGTYGQVGRLAALGQQVTSLARAMADERSGTATFISSGRPVAGLAALHQRYAITDARAAGVRRLVSQLGDGYPIQTRADTAQVLASIAKLPGLRRQAVQSQTSALAAITGYSTAISGLLPITDGIADLSSNATLITSVRALGSLSRMIDHASRQQAILATALTEGRFGPGALTALTNAQAQEASDLALFGNSASPQESRALTATLASPQTRKAQAVGEQAIAAGNGALALGPQASRQWSAGMSYTVGWMDHAQQQLAEWITADAQSQQRNAMRSAIFIGAAVLGALALILLGTILAARSWVRRRRRPEMLALESAEAPLPISAGAVSVGVSQRNHLLLERLIQLIDSAELSEKDPQRLARLFEMDHLATRIWRNSDSALALAGHEAPRPAGPLALVDVLRAAVSEIEDYGRVVLDVQQGVCVSGSAATDTVHLLAELLENATTFSPETTQVIVSGYAVVGGGSLVTITDSGPGMTEEELALFNWQLDNPAPADMAVARRMGLFAVAFLAARHGITVTLSKPLGGGTTAEVYLPAALISLGAAPIGRQGRRADEAALTRASDEASTADADPSLSALRFASGLEPSLAALETDAPEAVPALLGAPVPAPAPVAPADVTEPGPADSEPGDGPPIFESVRSGYLQAFGRDLPPPGEEEAGQPPAGQPVRPPASWGDGNGHVAAKPPTAVPPTATKPPTAGPPSAARPPTAAPPTVPGPPTADPPTAAKPPTAAPPTVPGLPTAFPPTAAGLPTAFPPIATGLPQSSPRPGQAHSAAADHETRPASAAESAESLRSKLASFQRGSRRARATAQMNRSAQPGQDG